jgi:hypothetical protein
MRADTVEISLPSGAHQTFHDIEADKFYVIEEGKYRLTPQRFGTQKR